MIKEDFKYYLKSGHPYFYIETKEINRCLEQLIPIADEFSNSNFQVEKSQVWDINIEDEDLQDPVALTEAITKSSSGTTWFLKNYNWFQVNAGSQVSDF